MEIRSYFRNFDCSRYCFDDWIVWSVLLVHLTHGKGEKFFGYKFSELCYYSHGPFPAGNTTNPLIYNYGNITYGHPICNPSCPGNFDLDFKNCGEYVGWSETITVVYLCLSIGGQLTVFVSRTKHSFWSRRPGYVLLIACLAAQVVATVFCVYWPVSLGITAYIGVPDNNHRIHPMQVVMKGIDWKMAAYVWIYCLIVFFAEDLTKVYCFYSFDNDDRPDVDIQEIKRKRKPFLPAVQSLFKRKKSKKSDKSADDKKVKKHSSFLSRKDTELP